MDVCCCSSTTVLSNFSVDLPAQSPGLPRRGLDVVQSKHNHSVQPLFPLGQVNWSHPSCVVSPSNPAISWNTHTHTHRVSLNRCAYIISTRLFYLYVHIYIPFLHNRVLRVPSKHPTWNRTESPNGPQCWPRVTKPWSTTCLYLRRS